jgi:hypothetical protein
LGLPLDHGWWPLFLNEESENIPAMPPSFKSIERDFPHTVEMLVPLSGFGRQLDDMYDWHRARGIKDYHGRSRRVEGRDIVSWCFGDAVTAGVFAAEFAAFTDQEIGRVCSVGWMMPP